MNSKRPIKWDMPKTMDFKIKYSIAIFVSLIVGFYVGFIAFPEALTRGGFEYKIAIELFFFIGISFASLITLNTLYYFWYLFFSNFSKIARKHGFKRKGIMKNGMLKRINNIEYEVYIFGTLMDRNIIFRIELGLIVDYKSKKNCVRYELNEYKKEHLDYFDNISELNKNSTYCFDKLDYFRHVNLNEYFTYIEKIIQIHELDISHPN